MNIDKMKQEMNIKRKSPQEIIKGENLKIENKFKMVKEKYDLQIQMIKTEK